MLHLDQSVKFKYFFIDFYRLKYLKYLIKMRNYSTRNRGIYIPGFYKQLSNGNIGRIPLQNTTSRQPRVHSSSISNRTLRITQNELEFFKRQLNYR